MKEPQYLIYDVTFDRWAKKLVKKRGKTVEWTWTLDKGFAARWEYAVDAAEAIKRHYNTLNGIIVIPENATEVKAFN